MIEGENGMAKYLVKRMRIIITNKDGDTLKGNTTVLDNCDDLEKYKQRVINSIRRALDLETSTKVKVLLIYDENNERAK